MKKNIIRGLAILTLASAPAGAQQSAPAAKESAMSCAQIAAEITKLKGEMASVGNQAVQSAFSQVKVQQTMSQGAMIASVAATAVPIAGLATEALLQAQKAQTGQAMAEAQRRAQLGMQKSRRIMELQALSAKQCGAPAKPEK